MGACCSTETGIEIGDRRTTRNTDDRRRKAASTRTFGDFPIHIAVIRQNLDYLQTVFAEVDDLDINELDDHGYTAIQLCVLTGWTDGLKYLLSQNCSPFMVNQHGWSLIQDAITLSQGKCLYTILTHICENNGILKQACLQYENSSNILNKYDDFMVEIKWDVSTWMPFIAKYCPKDIIRIYKKGCMIRVDTNISEFNQATMEWEYNARLMIFKGNNKGYLDIWDKTASNDGNNNNNNIEHSQTYLLDNINDINNKILTMDNKINKPNFVAIELLRDALLYSVINDLERNNDSKHSKNRASVSVSRSRSQMSNVSMSSINKNGNGSGSNYVLSNAQYAKLAKKLMKHLSTQMKKDMKILLSNKTLQIENLKLFQTKSWLGEIKTLMINQYQCQLYQIPSLSMVSNFRTLKLNSKMKQEFEQMSQKNNVFRDATIAQSSLNRQHSHSKQSIDSSSHNNNDDNSIRNAISGESDLSVSKGGYGMVSTEHVIQHSMGIDIGTQNQFEEIEPSQKGVIDLLLSLGRQNADDSSDEENDSDSDFSEDSENENNNNESGNNNNKANEKNEIKQIFHELTQDCDKMATKMIEYNKYTIKIEETEYKSGKKHLFSSKIRELWDWERTKQSAKLTLAMYEDNKQGNNNNNEMEDVKGEENDNKNNNDNFDLRIDEMVAILDIVSPKIRHAQNLKEFLMIELPNNGFPMKIEVPFYNLVTATLVFDNFKRGKLDKDLFDPNVAVPTGKQD